MIASPGVGHEFPVVPTLDPDREASPDFQTSYLVGKDEETVEVIYLGEVDSGKHLVVVPHQAWHRQGAKRKLTGLTKPLPLDVACCTVSAREEMLEDPMMKVWMGIASDLVISNLQIVMDKDTRDSLTCPFGVAGDPGYLPHVVALAQLAQEQFNFVSAESALEGGEREEAHLPVPAEHGLPASSLQTRVDQLEASLGSIQATLTTLVDRLPAAEEKRVTFAPKPKIIPTSPKSSTRTTKPTSSRYPSLDPGVVAAAISAGVEAQALEDMQRMMSSNLSGSKRLREPALRPSSSTLPQKTQAEALSESEEEAEGDGLQDGSSGEVQSSLEKLTEILTLLTAEKARKSKASKVDLALDSISGGSHGESGAGGGGLKRAAAARRALRQALQDHPEDISALLEKLMLEDLTSTVQGPGVPPATLSARGWVEYRSRIGSYRTAAYCAWSAGGILDDLIQGRPAHARAKAALLLLQLDQTAIDRGSWTLSSELALEQGPPFSTLSTHTLPLVGEGESPYSRLLDGRWAEICLSHLRDAEDFISKRKALGKKTEDVDKEKGDSKADRINKAKAKAKAKGGSEGMHEAVDSRADNGVVVPGSRAPTVVVPALMNSLGRVILRYGDRLALFCRSILAAKPSSRDEGARSLSLWPIPVPYPEAFRKEQGGGSLWRKRRVSLQILVFDWMFLGQPSVAPPCLKLGMRLSGRQWERIRLLEHLSEDSNSLFEVDAETMSRAAAKTEAASDELDALHRALMTSEQFSFGRCGYSGGGANVSPFDVDSEEEVFPFGCFEGEMAAKEFVVAKEIEADRVSFVGKPSFDPRPYFDETTTFAYDKPLERSKDFESLEPPPRVHVHANPLERKKLFRAMAQTDRLIALSEEEVRSDRLAGLFCVLKSLSKDRLILDSRPANGAEPPLSRWTSTMAAYSCLAGIELNDDEELRLSGRDISDYFYQFKVSKERGLRNVMSCWLSAEELEFIFDKPFSRGGFVGLNTLAMGDLAACEFAQCAHLGILLQSQTCTPLQLLQMHKPTPRGDMLLGVVIDDLICLEKVLSRLAGTASLSSSSTLRMSRVMKEYDKCGLPVNLKKSFDLVGHSSFWGVQVDGVKGLYRPNDSRFWPLVLVTIRVIALGVCTIGLLQSMAGSWISVLSVRRRLMSLMNYIFDAIACSSGPRQVVRLSGALRDELLTYVVCGGLAVVNLRAKVLPTVRATDSSNWGTAAVQGQVPLVVAKEAMRLSLSRSLWSKLLPPGKAWLREKGMLEPTDELPDSQCYDTHPFWEAIGRCYVFEEPWRRPHPRAIHINVGELRGYLRDELLTATEHTSVRIPYAMDSQVSLGALVKGRGSSKALNRELRRSLGPMICSDLYSGFGFWPSKMNRADAPTRDAAVPPPDLSKPAWLLDLEDGGLDRFDEWLGTVQEQGFPLKSDFENIGYKEMVDLRPAVALGVGEKRREKRVLRRKLPPKTLTFDESIGEEARCILCTFNIEQFLISDENGVIRGRGALDLYSGIGGVAKALSRFGCPWVYRSSTEDLLQRDLQERLLRLVVIGAVDLVGSAIVCSSFSIAITPPVRSGAYPRGVPWMPMSMKTKVKAGNDMADFQAEMHDCCLAYNTHFWTENPDGSHLWRQRKFKRFRSADSSWVFRFDMCRFGTRWRKRTRIATSVVKLRGLRMLCRCSPDQRHQPLRGQHPEKKVPWTKVAQSYPRGLSKLLGLACAEACGWWKGSALDIAGCSRCGSLRIGEAKNPGPRGARPERGFSLEERPIQTFASIALGEKRWTVFLRWAARSLGSEAEALDLFVRVPLMLAHAVRRFGDLEFSSGGVQSYYRHLILTAIRKVPTLRPYAGLCWDLAQRWSAVEPTEHRTPVPQPLFEALCSIGWFHGWRRWCGVLILAYYGVARVGEILHWRRRDLLLPGDLLENDNSGCAYLLLRRSKTMHRQPARIQHLRIDRPEAVALLALVFEWCDKDEFLYEGSAGVFRKRWDYILDKLYVPADLHVTPGGLRGGGAVACYRANMPIADLVWRMRLKQVSTLESYLQEVSALSVLTELSPQSRSAIRSAATFFRFLATG